MPPTEDLGVAAEPSRVPAAILVVGADNQQLARVVEQLRRRCGADYAIIAERSAARGIERLKGLRDEGSDLAIILADWQLPDGSGIVYLARDQSLDFQLLDLVTNTTRPLTHLSDQGVLHTFDVTPDCRNIVFDRSREQSDIYLIDLLKR